MTEEDSVIVDAMEKYGGSFVKALSGALYRADPSNFAILKAAFPEYFAQYKEMARKE